MKTAYVGVVRFEYLESPKGTIKDFLEFLADNSDEADWHLGTYHNVIVEYVSANLREKVNAFVKETTVTSIDRARVMEWVEQLPSKEGVITLHVDV